MHESYDHIVLVGGFSKAYSSLLAFLALLANREWARLQHAVGCDEATLHTARSLIRSLDPRPGQRFGPQEARYVVPDVIVKKVRDRWMAIIAKSVSDSISAIAAGAIGSAAP